MPPLLALVDCNNFYASCERVFQPELRGKPVVVLSNNDGCVIARSNEAKALGIKMGEPWHLRRDFFAANGVIVRSSNYALYGDMSARVMSVLGRFTPEVEIYSIDEAFLGFGGFAGREEDQARELRRVVLQWTGIPVSVGIAPTKLLAKMANRLAKKDPSGDGVRVLSDEAAQRDALAQIELEDLWGVAGRLAARLREIGIPSPLAFRDADPRFVRERLNVVAERMIYELRGVPCIALEDVVPDRKTVMASRSFGRPVTARPELEAALASYVGRAAEKIRRQGLACAELLVFVHTNRFRPQEPQYSGSQVVQLPVATADTSRLVRAALRGLEALWRPGYRYKKAGVVLLDLVPAPRVQGDLFHSPDDGRSLARMRVLDWLNARYGRDTVTVGRVARQKGWQLRSKARSARYTTDWAELPQAL